MSAAPSSPLFNGARGEVVVTLGGRPRRLCVTLGALAEIETSGEGVERPDASVVIRVLAALLRGGGEAVEPADLLAERITPQEAARAVFAAFEAALKP